MNIDSSVARECKHTGRRVANDEVQYDVSCYHELHCLRVRESRRQDIQEQQRGRLSNINQHGRTIKIKVIFLPGAPAPTR